MHDGFSTSKTHHSNESGHIPKAVEERADDLARIKFRIDDRL